MPARIGTVYVISGAVALFLAVSITRASVAATNPPPTKIVHLRPGADPDGLVHEFGLTPKFIYRYAVNGLAAPMDSAAAERLSHDARVLSIGDNGEVRSDCVGVGPALIVPASAIVTQQIPAGIMRMGLPNFPMTRYNGQDHRFNVDVAVLDSGIQLDHPDLNVYLPGSTSFADGSTNGSDWHGHGTHVSGIIGALDNDIGVVGVAPGVRLWSVEVVGPTVNDQATLLAGVDYIAQHADRISVVNVSLTTYAGNIYDTIHAAFSNLVSRGVVVVAAAGNNAGDICGDTIWGNSDDVLPAGLPEVMAVSAMDPNTDWFWDCTNSVWVNANNPAFDQIPFFSNYSETRHNPEFVHSQGGGIDVAAPGVFVLSTWNGTNYAKLSGTSMASPHAAGLVALYIAANGRATNAAGVYKIRQAIVDGSQPQLQWFPGGQPAYYYVDSYSGYDTFVLSTRDPDVYASCAGSFGCITNDLAEPLAVPSESWVPAPTIVSQSLSSNGFAFSFTTVPGYVYTPQFTDTLGASHQWTDLGSTNGTGDLVTASDSAVSSGRYYRIRRQPRP